MSTKTTSTSTRFIVAVQNSHGGWNKIGFVSLNKRCEADADIKAFFPSNTRGYDEALKSCRWLAGETGAISVDWSYRNMALKTIKL